LRSTEIDPRNHSDFNVEQKRRQAAALQKRLDSVLATTTGSRLVELQTGGAYDDQSLITA